MNWLNHVLTSFLVLLIVVPPKNTFDFVLYLVASALYGLLLPDLDHATNKKAPWYFKRTWTQEPLSIILIALPLGFILSFIDKKLFYLVVIPWAVHVILDYLCIFPARPLAPISNIEKPLGLGIFHPDNLFYKSENSRRWIRLIKEKNIKCISENYFTFIIISALIIYFCLKIFKR